MTEKDYDRLMSLVFVVGIYEGVLPFPATWFGWHPFLSFPLRLDAPAWWLVSGVVVVVALVLLQRLDEAKKRASHDDAR